MFEADGLDRNKSPLNKGQMALTVKRMGCDELYERGFLAVGSTGRVIRLSGVPTTPALEAYLAKLAGRECRHWQLPQAGILRRTWKQQGLDSEMPSNWSV